MESTVSCFGVPNLHIVGPTPEELKLTNLSPTSLNLLRSTGLRDLEIRTLYDFHKLTDEKVKLIITNYPKFSSTLQSTYHKVSICYMHTIREQEEIVNKTANLALEKQMKADERIRKHEEKQKRIAELKAVSTPAAEIVTASVEPSPNYDNDALIPLEFPSVSSLITAREVASPNEKYVVVVTRTNELMLVRKISRFAYVIRSLLNFFTFRRIKMPKYSKESANKFEVLKTIANKMATIKHWNPRVGPTNTITFSKTFLAALKVTQDTWLEIADAAIEKQKTSAPAA